MKHLIFHTYYLLHIPAEICPTQRSLEKKTTNPININCNCQKKNITIGSFWILEIDGFRKVHHELPVLRTACGTYRCTTRASKGRSKRSMELRQRGSWNNMSNKELYSNKLTFVWQGQSTIDTVISCNIYINSRNSDVWSSNLYKQWHSVSPLKTKDLSFFWGAKQLSVWEFCGHEENWKRLMVVPLSDYVVIPGCH